MSRLQLALNVDDLDASVAFYTKLFGTAPAKTKPGYANFAVAEPPLKLILIENPGQGGSVNHLGVEVADADTVDAEQTRLAEQGLASIDERGTTCCYAKQDKFWVQGTPDRERWTFEKLARPPASRAESEALLARNTAMPARSAGSPQRAAGDLASTRSYKPGT